MSKLTRRSFLYCGAATGALATLSGGRVRAAGGDGQVNLGLVGCGWRGGQLFNAFKGISGVRFAGFCDPDEARLDELAGQVPGSQRWKDLRAMLDSPEIDAVAIATCNHWHALAAIWAMQAGKHVYVEKPLGHYNWEGRQIVNAARRYDRICQVGTQQRSDPMQDELKQFLHEDRALGPVESVRVSRFGMRGTIGKLASPLAAPATLDYDLWLGPAQDEPIFRKEFHYDWHWDWNTGSGEMGNWGVHIVDDVRNVVFQDRVALPRRIVAGGGRFAWHDAGNTPNVHAAVLDTGSIPVIVGVCNVAVKPGSKSSPTTPGPGSGYTAFCAGGRLEGQRGRGAAFDAAGKKIREFTGNGGGGHQANFIKAVRTGDASILKAPAETGHNSTEWCSLANVAYRAGAALEESDRAAVLDDIQSAFAGGDKAVALVEQLRNVAVAHDGPQAARDFRLGPELTFDPQSERFVGPGSEAGNALLRRQDRPGFEVPTVAMGDRQARRS